MTTQPIPASQPMEGIEMTLSGQRKLKTLFRIIPQLTYLSSEDKRMVIKERLENDPVFCRELGLAYQLLAKLLRVSASREDLKQNISAALHESKKRYHRNMNKIFQQLKPTRTAVYSLYNGYRNAGSYANIYVYPIDPGFFLESPDPQHWDDLENKTKEFFFRFRMLDTPCYFAFCFAFSKPGTAFTIAKFAETVMGIAAIDIPVLPSAEDTLNFMDNSFQVVGPNSELAHLIISGTHGYVEGVYEDYDGTKKLPVPLGPSLIGKLLSTPLGKYFSSLKGSPLEGFESMSCRYRLERYDADDFALRGITMVLDSGHVESVATCYNGSIDEFTNFFSMDIYCLITRALIQEGNNLANGKFGEKEQRALESGLVNYFNGLKREQVIEHYVLRDDIVIDYDKKKKTAKITIPIKYAGAGKKLIFSLTGEEGGILLPEKTND
ncbi:MAG: hypothetical protein KDD02_15035 [Phaeodactylibacter sp.]|nr:hypothetical protein [Phaeodactylibacter sp.]MCB9302587.1 hypothetical protein [Lewinellaceae bacterium]